MLSCLNGVLEYYRTTGDKQMLDACLNAWQDIVEHRLYLTGTASYREFFHDDFDLPNVNNVGETCVTVTWLQFNAQLLRLTGEARSPSSLNESFSSAFRRAMPGRHAWGLLRSDAGQKTLQWHPRWPLLPVERPARRRADPNVRQHYDSDGVVVNLYEAGTAKLKLRDGTAVTLETKTKYPGDGRIQIAVTPAKPKSFASSCAFPPGVPTPHSDQRKKGHG